MCANHAQNTLDRGVYPAAVPRPADGPGRPAAGRSQGAGARAPWSGSARTPSPIFWSAPARVFSTDVEYQYRQDSNLLYLTGLDQEDTILVLMPGNETRKEMLFVREADARREHWNGHSLTTAEASAATGIQTVMTANQFEPFVAAVFSKRAQGGSPTESARFFQALSDSRAKLALLLEPQVNLSTPAGPAAQFAAKLRERFFGFNVVDATPILADLRQIKTAYEQDVLRKSVAISSEAHRAGMRAAAPGKYEYEVEAAIEEVYLRNGAMSWGYPSIVGSGPNATILHYQKSSRRMETGDLLLVDAAANYQGLTGDITRTYPINGTYSRDAAGDLRDRATRRSRPARKPRRPEPASPTSRTRATTSCARGSCGSASSPSPPARSSRSGRRTASRTGSAWTCTTVGSRTRPLEPGMAFTIEPGIYIREAALDDLPKTPANAAFIEKVRPVVQRYKNLGVRIEDSYLLTATGLERLSATVPRTIDEVESLMKQRSTARR